MILCPDPESSCCSSEAGFIVKAAFPLLLNFWQPMSLLVYVMAALEKSFSCSKTGIPVIYILQSSKTCSPSHVLFGLRSG